MNASVISALAALFGAAIGGLTSLLASWLTQQTQTRAQWLAQDKLRRQELYKEFIEEASKCYFHALQQDKADIPALVGLYAKIGRMRFLSSSKVVESAEQIGRKILDTYLEQDKTFLELREMVISGSIDFLRDFSEICRAELGRSALNNSEKGAGCPAGGKRPAGRSGLIVKRADTIA
jgi:hypothetical protein